MDRTIMRVSGTTALLATICLMAMTCAAIADDNRASSPLVLAKEGFFYVGGWEFTQQSPTRLVDQMFVEYQIPAKVTSPYPIVMIHGNFQNGTSFLGTPDDREGWAEYFLRRGYPVYVVDSPGRGRSYYNAAADGPLAMVSTETLERNFTAPEHFNLWPQAHLHTQWPGTGMVGDPVFEQFRASENPTILDNVVMDTANRAAGVALLRRIGPAIIMTHSRSGQFGWEIADDAPELVKGIVSVEPPGPPFYNHVPPEMGELTLARWGITRGPVTYDPPVKDMADLAPKREDQAQGAELEPCWFPSTPHRLPHLVGIPEMIVIGEASAAAAYGHCTTQYLTRAGVANDLIRLGDHGIHGNGHMMMLEKNNLQIARLIADWISQYVK